MEINQQSCHCHYSADLKDNLDQTIAVIRCEDYQALQWIKNGLEEAKADYKEVGRPLTLRMHDGVHSSLLSDAFKDDGNKKVNMGGILNLIVLLLIMTNIKNLLISHKENGFTLGKLYNQVVDSKMFEDISNY